MKKMLFMILSLASLNLMGLGGSKWSVHNTTESDIDVTLRGAAGKSDITKTVKKGGSVGPLETCVKEIEVKETNVPRKKRSKTLKVGQFGVCLGTKRATISTTKSNVFDIKVA